MSVHKLPAATNELERTQIRERTLNADLSSDPLPESDPDSGSSSSTGEDDDDDWNDWVEDDDPANKVSCISLFDDTKHGNQQETVKYDKEKHGFNLQEFCAALKLDFYARVRLVNHLRKVRLEPEAVKALTGKEDIFSDDALLIPVIQDDPYLRMDADDSSDEDDEEPQAGASSQSDDKDLRRKQEWKMDSEYQKLVRERFGSEDVLAALREDVTNSAQPSTSTTKVLVPKRDDDTHYFNSYGDNEIHYVMLKDKVRTSTYASFIMNSPDLFTDAIVLDVGCGTGILSLLAARAGAKRVFAVDASEYIANKARRIVKLNELDDVITVINGKVEEITLPDGITHVDVIISEWMGYALLYESMLDSVLVARDRFLKPTVDLEPARGREAILSDDMMGTEGESPRGGVLAPSQTRMLLGLCSAHDAVKDRVEFWSDVYGFDMTPMSEGVYDEAVIDVVSEESMLTEPAIIKDINIAKVTPRDLSFSAPFTLIGTSARKTVAHAFILYFDAFFTPDGAQVSLDTRATVVGGEPGSSDNAAAVVAEVWRPGSPSRARSPSVGAMSDSALSENIKEKDDLGGARTPSRRERMRRQSSVRLKKEQARGKSFTTGPESEPTHWKQTLFLLKEPMVVHEGCEVSGTIHCRKSADNSRELDVEIHYVVKRPDKDGQLVDDTQMIVQSFKVR